MVNRAVISICCRARCRRGYSATLSNHHCPDWEVFGRAVPGRYETLIEIVTTSKDADKEVE